MSKKTLSDLYEQSALSETASDELLTILLKRQQREQFKILLRKEAKIIQLRRMIWASVVVCTLLGGFGVWKMAQKQAAKPSVAPLKNEIYAQISPQTVLKEASAPSFPSNIMMGDPSKDPSENFRTAYETQNYAQAITFAAQIPLLEPRLQVCLGYCYLQTGDLTKSIAILDAVYKQEAIAKEEVRWCLGLAHGLKGDWNRMKLYLREIQPRQFHYEAAQALLHSN